MITFTNPMWLWGLLGLLIPIGIHLLSRKQGKVIYIGSVRHLKDSNTAQFSSIRLNEMLLLVVRLMLFTMLVFLLADMRWAFAKKQRAKWLVLERGTELTTEGKALSQRAQAESFEIRTLEPGFPETSDRTPLTRPINYYALVTELQNKNLDSAVVVSFNKAKNFAGEKVALSGVNWITVESKAQRFPIDAALIAKDTLSIRIENTSPNETEFNTAHFHKTSSEKFFRLTGSPDSVKILTTDTLFIGIISEPEFAYDVRILKAALMSIDEQIPERIIFHEASPGPQRPAYTFVFSSKVSTQAGKTIGYVPCSFSNVPLIAEKEIANNYCSGAGQLDWAITKRLNEGVALEENLAMCLFKILQEDLRPFKTDKDIHILPNEQAWSKNVAGSVTMKGESRSVTTTLAIILLCLLIIERVLSAKKNQ